MQDTVLVHIGTCEVRVRVRVKIRVRVQFRVSLKFRVEFRVLIRVRASEPHWHLRGTQCNHLICIWHAMYGHALHHPTCI